MFTVCLPYQAERADESFTTLFNGHRGQLSSSFGVLIDLQRNLSTNWERDELPQTASSQGTVARHKTLEESAARRPWAPQRTLDIEKSRGGVLKKETSRVWRWRLINPSMQKTEAGRSPGVPSRSTYKVPGQSRLQSKTLSPKQTSKKLRKTKKNDKEWSKGGRRGGKRKKKTQEPYFTTLIPHSSLLRRANWRPGCTGYGLEQVGLVPMVNSSAFKR